MTRRKLRALVVDDEPLARDELVFLLGELDVKVVGQAGDATGAIELLDDAEPDVVFVDLRMPGPDGLSLAERLMKRRESLPVVVVSAHDDGAIRAYEAGIVDYLLKPVRLERLAKAVARARDRAPDSRQGDEPLTRLAVRRRGRLVVVNIDDVVWFEVKDELVWAVTDDDRFALDLTLRAVEERVPEGEFFRSHRGSLVRLDRIRGLEPAGAGTYEIHLEHPDAPTVPLARERARLLRELIPIAG
ncbi:MAG TPA: LytTR family DNA-binding domain-containing protein [Sandaracinaceae bacterium LLY-WYZ-13_1]|nr:LytTR family DNA-binding domain-containing protein [Sandaracinaceae bacterium LLY-WYZ-13_1]